MTLDQLLEAAERQIRRQLLDRKVDQLLPTFMLVQPSGAVPIACQWTNTAEKEAAVAVIREEMRQRGTVRYSFISEAWQSKEGDVPPGTMPRDDPKRVEVVFALAADGVETKWKMWRMIRAGGKHVTALVPHPEKIEMVSWFADLLSKGHA